MEVFGLVVALNLEAEHVASALAMYQELADADANHPVVRARRHMLAVSFIDGTARVRKVAQSLRSRIAPDITQAIQVFDRALPHLIAVRDAIQHRDERALLESRAGGRKRQLSLPDDRTIELGSLDGDDYRILTAAGTVLGVPVTDGSRAAVEALIAAIARFERVAAGVQAEGGASAV